MRASRSLVTALALALAQLGASCGEDSSDSSATTTSGAALAVGPQNYTVIVDGPSTLGAENFVLGTYFPGKVAVRPGDTLTFDNRSSNDIHTVTFGVKSDRSDQPPAELSNGQANPAAFAPCYTTEPARPDLTCPPPPAEAPEYTGTGYWNAGVLLPTALPAEAGPKQATVKLAAAIPPGAYTVTCTLHPFMEGTVEVVERDQDRLTPDQVASAADRELAEATAKAKAMAVPTPETRADGAEVVSGWGDKLVAFNRFHPETVSVKVGQTVQWRGVSPFMPHTVSFDPPFKSPDEPDALLPAGVKSGGRFGGGVAHSGIFGPPPGYPVETYSLTFTTAGVYPYLCLLHPGMAGTVKVE